MSSARFPGKVLVPLAGAPVLEHVVNRVRRASRVDELMVATSVALADDAIVEWARSFGVLCIRGSESDVLSRFALAATVYDASVVVRVTADCPLLSPMVLDAVVEAREAASADYASNTISRRFPHGLDVECLTRSILEAAAAGATLAEEREHVTPYVYNRPSQFRIASVTIPDDWSWLRWTLDTQEDLRLLHALFAAAPSAMNPMSDWRSTAAIFASSPVLRAANESAIAAKDTAACAIPLK